MKKLLCVLLVMTVLLSFAACGEDKEEEKKVTIYIPESIHMYGPNGEVYAQVDLVFEEGWQTKESFTVTYSGDLELFGNSVPKMTYSGNTVATEIPGMNRNEAVFDSNGRQIALVNYYLSENAAMDKMEATMTYDNYGRKLTEESKNYYPNATEPVLMTRTYVYTDTETGSEGRCEEGEMVAVLTYDKEYRLVKQSTTVNGEEMSRTENTYDAQGNLERAISYVYGQKSMETAYTFKAVQVSSQTADRLPQFKREK